MRRSSKKTREQVLTQAHPAKFSKSADAVVLKEADVFLSTTEGGDIPLALPHRFGLFFKDCRFLGGCELTLNDLPLVVLSGGSARGFATHHHLSNPDLARRGAQKPIERNTIGIFRERLIRAAVVYERQSAENRGREPVRVVLTLRFRARFEDLFVIKGYVRPPRGTLRKPRIVGANRVELGYAGKDGVLRSTTMVFSPKPDHLDGKSATFEITLAPGQTSHLGITITPSEHTAPARHVGRRQMPIRLLKQAASRAEDRWLGRSARVRSDNPLFDRVFHRAQLDLHLLRTRLNGLEYFAAGIPWYVTLFGRDSATASLQALPYSTRTARSTLALLARYQATTEDAYRDAEPGKILHEFRCGELANLGAIPQSHAYYGAVDATMLFLILMAEYVRWSGDLDLARRLRPNVDAALGWMNRHAARNGGYFSYEGQYPNGLVNQGWKDSGNAIVNADGSLAEPPIALCEVQASAYRAWRQTAVLLRVLGDVNAAAALDGCAEALRSRFDRDFWSEEIGGYVLARQAGGRPAAVASSNMGQVLWGGLASPAHAARIAERLMSPDMFSGWGIRTLSKAAAAYNPMGYHLGSVWPHDNSIILAGLRRYGHDEPALRVFDALFDAATNSPNYQLPELYCGYDRTDSEHRPVGYPVACRPQAWASASLPYALWNLLGLSPDAGTRALELRRPRLPAWLRWVTIEDLCIGGACVDLQLARSSACSDRVEVRVSVTEGDLRVRATEGGRAPHLFE